MRRCWREGRQVYSNIALNDAVISKGSIARVVRLDIFTEEGRLTRVGGDGIIVSTPTGSTGYSMAAGGPIVEPTAKNLLLTPICPHSTRSSSYVLSPDHVITVEAGGCQPEIRLSFRRRRQSVFFEKRRPGAGEHLKIHHKAGSSLQKKAFAKYWTKKWERRLLKNEKRPPEPTPPDHQRGDYRNPGAAAGAAPGQGHQEYPGHDFPGHQGAAPDQGAQPGRENTAMPFPPTAPS